MLATYENRDAGIYLANELTGECKQIPAPPFQVLKGVACSAKAGMPLLLTETSDKYTLWIMKPGGTEQRKLLDREKKIFFAMVSNWRFCLLLPYGGEHYSSAWSRSEPMYDHAEF
jgi:hypothetical protein